MDITLERLNTQKLDILNISNSITNKSCQFFNLSVCFHDISNFVRFADICSIFVWFSNICLISPYLILCQQKFIILTFSDFIFVSENLTQSLKNWYLRARTHTMISLFLMMWLDWTNLNIIYHIQVWAIQITFLKFILITLDKLRDNNSPTLQAPRCFRINKANNLKLRNSNTVSTFCNNKSNNIYNINLSEVKCMEVDMSSWNLNGFNSTHSTSSRLILYLLLHLFL